MRTVILMSYTKCAVETVVWRASLPFIQSELVSLSSIKLSHGARKQSNKPGRDKATPIFQRKLNRVAWVEAILPMLHRKGCASLSGCSKLGLEQVRSLVVVNQLCPIYISGQRLKPTDDTA